VPPERHPNCWENLRFQDLGIDTTRINAFPFEQGFVEFALRIDDLGESYHGYWSQVVLWITDPEPSDPSQPYREWLINGVTYVADGNYHIYQYPLSAFQSGDTSLTVEELHKGLHAFRVGLDFHDEATGRIDSAYIRY